jgi:F-type H+-transporting ATPase subunit epsilon
MILEILSPQKTIHAGSAQSVTLPGLGGLFTILDRHAPMIAALDEGCLRYCAEGKESELDISGGWVEMKNNKVSVCVEIRTI